jgi:hypothetical protein
MIFVTFQGPKLIFLSKLSHQGPKMPSGETPGTKFVISQNFNPSVIFDNFLF